MGRCAALSVAAEAHRRANARRTATGDAEVPPQQPLRDFLAAELAALVATTPEDRALTLEALRHDDEAGRAATARRELRRR